MTQQFVRQPLSLTKDEALAVTSQGTPNKLGPLPLGSNGRSIDPGFSVPKNSPVFSAKPDKTFVPPYQVTSLGNADPILSKTVPLGTLYPQPVAMNPILTNFSSMIGKDFNDKIARDPHLQASLFDIDNAVKGNAGIHRTSQDGLQELGMDLDGKPLYASPQLQGPNANNFKVGETQLTNTGHLLDTLGTFRDEREAQAFAARSKIAGSPEFMGELTAQISSGDKKGAINSIMTKMGHPNLDDLGKDPNNKMGLGTAFAAHNMVENWDKMTNSQRSMTLSGISIASYQYADGKPLTKRTLIQGQTPDDPSLTVGTALGLASNGVDVPNLMKNWDQLDAMQRLTYGKGTAAQMAVIGKKHGLLGQADFQGKAVNVSSQQLGNLGFKASPSAGVGAIVGPSGNLPNGYTVVAAGTEPNTVVAVPAGHEGTTATMNRSATITTLNTTSGAPAAGQGAFRIYQGWNKASKSPNSGMVGGTAVTSGLSASTQNDPYLQGSVVALSATSTTHKKDSGTNDKIRQGVSAAGAGYNVYNKLTGGESAPVVGGVVSGVNIALSDASDKEKAVAARRATEDTLATYYTAGVFGYAKKADAMFNKGRLQKARIAAEKYVPGLSLADNLGAKTLSVQGGRSNKAHIERDQMRLGLQNIQLLDGDYNVTLADGTKVNAGLDNDDGNHEFRDPSKVPPGNEVRTLRAYDVDYTNDLDFSANLMTVSLMRLISGGKGTAIDQTAGQLANTSLANVGFGKDMTEDNYTKAQANVRGFFVQSGIKSKEDAYALANQAFAEGRLNEMDLSQVQQGINMTFDDDGYSTAQSLMPGRMKGIETASSMNGQGPEMVYQHAPLPIGPTPLKTDRNVGNVDLSTLTPQERVGATEEAAAGLVEEEPAQGFYLKGGSYQSTAGMFQTALINYQDPYKTKMVQVSTPRNMTKEELQVQNSRRYQ